MKPVIVIIFKPFVCRMSLQQYAFIKLQKIHMQNYLWVLCCGVISLTMNLTILPNTCTCFVLLMVLIFKFRCKTCKMGITELILSVLGEKCMCPIQRVLMGNSYSPAGLWDWLNHNPALCARPVSCFDMHVLVNSGFLHTAEWVHVCRVKVESEL